VDHDLEQELPVDTYAADKGYDDSHNHYHLETKRLQSAIHLKKTELKRKTHIKKFGWNWLRHPNTSKAKRAI
jgi:hypothetical protein